MRYMSLFSGIEAATVAWEPLGWTPVGFSEIEPFTSAVLAHRYPDVPNLGDVVALRNRLLAGEDVAGLLGNPPDLIVGGSPCTAFSIAGARGGLLDPRGNLTLTYAEIIHALNPEIVVWENVPGVLSMRDNAFGHLLGALVGEDGPLEPPGKKWPNAGAVSGPQRTIAWRVLDAQYFGVAQQRRRVFLVASRRDGPVKNPWEILFEFGGVRRDTPPRRKTQQEVAGTLASRTGAGGFPGTDECCSGYVQPVFQGCVTGDITHTLRADGFDASEDGTGRGTPIVATFAENTRGELRLEGGDGSRTGALSTGGGKPGQGRSCILQAIQNVSGTLKSCARSGGGSNSADHAAAGYILPVCFNSRQDPIVTGNRAGALSATSPQAESVFFLQAGVTRENPNSGPDGVGVRDGVAYTLEARSEAQMVCPSVALRGRDTGAELEMRHDDVASALRCSQGGSDKAMLASPSYGVRRLMPVECARLQGFPDAYLDIPYRGKSAADGPKYKALGNSMAVPVMRWIGRRILESLDSGNSS